MSTLTETATATAPPDVDAVMTRLQKQLSDLGDPDEVVRVHQAAIEDFQHRYSAIDGRIQTIRTAVNALKNVTPKIAAESRWRDHLLAWHSVLSDELESLPSVLSGTAPDRIRAEGLRRNVTLSLDTIQYGQIADAGWEPETLRLGELMREAGYVAAKPIENQLNGQLPWYGSLSEVERRLKVLCTQRDDAQHRLDEALRDS